jgi:hypothetical protein
LGSIFGEGREMFMMAERMLLEVRIYLGSSMIVGCEGKTRGIMVDMVAYGL